MALRMTGMMSGLDTENIIQELVSVKRKKVDTKKKEQTKLNWKQDAWKELNGKLKNLMTKFTSNMRFSSSYSKKVTKVSNNSAVSVITGEGAVNGVQSLSIDKLAKTAYMTGGQIKGEDGQELTALSKLSDIDGFDVSGNATFTLQTGNSNVDINVNEDTTISDVLTQLKDAGLNASFDAKWGRISISAKESGAASDFSFSAADENGQKVMAALGLQLAPAGLDRDDPEAIKYASKTDGQNARIYLNGALYENSTNSFEINGLTFTALNETQPGEVITVTTEQDTDGIYDMVKNFLKEYNAVVNEMDKLYNAASSKGYEPLTDDEKEAMSESEIKKYEDKIKDSLLRRDENLASVNSSIQSVMAAGVDVNGTIMYLHDFGIDTLGYFNSADNEKHAYHIDGDKDDDYTSGNADKLKSMIASDPDTVISFFTNLARNLYGKMDAMSKSVEGYRTYGSFYDDKKMKSDYDGYTSKIAEMEKKVADYEDKWYAKFSKMETALAKMQSNASAVTGLLGG